MDLSRPRRSALTKFALQFSKDPDVFVLEDMFDGPYRDADEENDIPNGQGECMEVKPSTTTPVHLGRTAPESFEGASESVPTSEDGPKWRRKAPAVTRTANIRNDSLQYWYEDTAAGKEARTRPVLTVADWAESMAKIQQFVVDSPSRVNILEEMDKVMQPRSNGPFGWKIDIHLVKEPMALEDWQVPQSDLYLQLLNCEIPIFVEQDQGTWTVGELARSWRESVKHVGNKERWRIQISDASCKKPIQSPKDGEAEPSPEPSEAGYSSIEEIVRTFVAKIRDRVQYPLTYLVRLDHICGWDIPKALRAQSLKRVLFERDDGNVGLQWRPRTYCMLRTEGAYTAPNCQKIGYLLCAAVLGGEDGGRQMWELPVGNTAKIAESFRLLGNKEFSPDQEWATIDMSSGEGVLILPPGQIYGIRTINNTATVCYDDWTASTFHLTIDAIREEFVAGAGSNETALKEEWSELLRIIDLLGDDGIFNAGLRKMIAHSGRKLVSAYMDRTLVGELFLQQYASWYRKPRLDTFVMKTWIWLQEYDGS